MKLSQGSIIVLLVALAILLAGVFQVVANTVGEDAAPVPVVLSGDRER
ncbi:MAG: hypothetical protein ACYC2Y_11120 [Armatimonadota bacterium]